MVFFQSHPHLALQKFIGQYLYFSFNTCELPCLEQTLLPYDISAISFFIGPAFLDCEKSNTGVINSIPYPDTANCYYAGLRTSPFSIHFKGNEEIKVLAIAFKPPGFSALFGRNRFEITERVPDFTFIAGATEASLFLEQLGEAKDFATQIKICNNFFLKRIQGSYNNGEQVNEACKKLMLTDGQINMRELAYRTNMSQRNLERQFIEKVGVSPKTFARFKKFHHALSLMNSQKPHSWADISYNCGYYDQAHFINEFKSFTNQSPSAYAPQKYMLYNQIILFRNFPSF